MNAFSKPSTLQKAVRSVSKSPLPARDLARYKATDIASWIIGNLDRDAGDSITHLKLQKLIYYSQAWALVLLDRPLFDEQLQAWAHGPVAESVFHEYKAYGWKTLPLPAKSPDLRTEDASHLRDILSVYGEFSARRLEAMTHAEDPWRLARGKLPAEARSTAIISRDIMKAYYGKLYSQAAVN